jgi:hypothetical protein
MSSSKKLNREEIGFLLLTLSVEIMSIVMTYVIALLIESQMAFAFGAIGILVLEILLFVVLLRDKSWRVIKAGMLSTILLYVVVGSTMCAINQNIFDILVVAAYSIVTYAGTSLVYKRVTHKKPKKIAKYE